MQHTYLRYECADAFGLISATASSKVPHSSATLAFASDDRNCPIILSTTGSQFTGFHLRTTNTTLKIGHRDEMNGGVGTGRALNSSQVVCLAVSRGDGSIGCRVATGWVDGAVRVYSLSNEELSGKNESLMVQTFLSESDSGDDSNMPEPLVLNGHSASAIRSISFDSRNRARLASGSSDGAVVIWDVVEECGLFRLLGHRGAISEVHFAHVDSSFDSLITSSLDGLVKLWDLSNQCCVQTIASHRGQVWASVCSIGHGIPGDPRNPGSNERSRLITGDDDGMAKVWSLEAPRVYARPQRPSGDNHEGEELGEHGDEEKLLTSCCKFMGALRLPTSAPSVNERIAVLQMHDKYLGICHANSRTVYIYVMRDQDEARRRKQRRISRQRQKVKVVGGSLTDQTNDNRKRGILDDADRGSSIADPIAETIEASDEFEFLGTATASHKIRSFVFAPWRERGGTLQIICSLTTNAIEAITLERSKTRIQVPGARESSKVAMISNIGHSTGIRAIDISSDDSLACTVSKGCFKIWNVARRKCIQSISQARDGLPLNGLCAVFLPGNSHVIVGTREGHLLILDIAVGEVVVSVEKAHDQPIWSVDLQRATEQRPRVSLITGSADKTVKFWDVEEKDESPHIVHTRTLEMSDDVVAVRYSNAIEASKRMVFVSSMDSTVKVFFDDTLKFFLNLYGHKLPALALDASDDDAILATAGADKLVKIWGLDFGDTHRTLQGHEDSITDLRFVRRTHNFFTSSKDGSLRYWDGDRFEQILVLNGHFAEVSSLAISRTGACVLSAGMDRQVRVWERTKDIVFLDEERDLELEKNFDRVDGRADYNTAEILRRKAGDDDAEEEDEMKPQSVAAMRQSMLSVAAGDRILASLELADMESKSNAASQQGHSIERKAPNPLLLGMDPASYVIWVLKSVKQAELEQSLLVLPLEHVYRMLYYLVISLRKGQGTEICSRVAVFLVKTHQHQIQANHWKLAKPLKELRRLLRLRLEEARCIIGFNISGLSEVSKNPFAPVAEEASF